jgi:conjugal transfer pilin signal peptidase TrbI|tara:strand:- start:36823 stop:37353 length:531 start_codon:yes stop_codon:yes gene_type:complete
MSAAFFISRNFLARLKRPLLLAALVSLPLVYAPIAKFSNNHALLINTSPSLPHWAFWLTKNKPVERGSLIFFEPPVSPLLVHHFGEKPLIFGKRVTGFPGDEVRHVGGYVHINNRRIARTKPRSRLGIELLSGPEGIIPENCYYVGTNHIDGFDSRYAAIGWVCVGQIIGTGKAIL